MLASASIVRMKKICEREGCGIEFNVRPCDIKRGRGKYCSQSCNASATKNLVLASASGAISDSGASTDKLQTNHIKPILDKLHEVSGTTGMTQAQKLSVARQVLENAERKVGVIGPGLEVPMEDPKVTRRKAIYRKHGRCIEVDGSGNETYYDENGVKIG